MTAQVRRRGGDGTEEHEQPEPPPLPRKLVAEAVGAFFLTLAAAGPAMTATDPSAATTNLAAAAAAGLVVMALVYALGDVSGAHFNPAVTLAFACRRVFPWRLTGPYVIAQVGGATGAAALLAWASTHSSQLAMTLPKVGDGPALVVEAVLTVLLVSVILNTANRHSLIGTDAAIAVGATIAAATLAGSDLSGASMNPARSLGPALVAAHLDHIHVFVVGPLLGAVAATLLSFVTHPHRDEHEEAEVAAGDHGSRVVDGGDG